MWRPKSKSKIQVHPLFGVAFLISLAALLSITGLLSAILPEALEAADEKDHPDSFIQSRAAEDLRVLVEDIGPRIAGTHENENITVDFLLKSIKSIQEDAHPNKKIEVDVQTVSGAYYLDSMKAIVSYGNVQNVVVKLHARTTTDYSLLLNSHFDTVPISPGGSDDGINCVAMLEILRKLSKSPELFQNNIIFLFNGAEETPLQAAHGFVTQHKWAKGAKVLINLEAAGAGGQSTLFQAGPDMPWLLKYFKKVPYPTGNAVGEELFETGVIPSDTDFRLFRDYGGMIGYDFAFIKNAHRYHTRFDKYENIPPGSYQQVGENTLVLTRALANAPELPNPQDQPKGKMIYFDFFSLFVVVYSTSTALTINIVISLLSLIIALLSFYIFELKCELQTFKYIAWMLLGTLLSWIAGVTVTVVIGTILDALKFSMRWYSSSWLIVGLYILPTIACCCGITLLFNKLNLKKGLTPANHAQIQIQLVRLIWTVVLLIGTIVSIRSVYLIFFQVFFQTIIFAFIQIFFWQRNLKRWFVTFILGSLIPTMCIMQATITSLSFLIPISGRIGTKRNPELEIAIITSIETILITSYFIPLVNLLRKSYIFIATLCGIFLIFFIIAFTPVTFPYTANEESPAPQRYWIHHSIRTLRNDSNTVYKQDTGYFVLNMDRNSPAMVEEEVDEFTRAVSIDEDCNKSLFCGLPLGRFSIFTRTWIPSTQYPVLSQPINLTVDSKEIVSETVTRYNFTATGPHRFEVYLSPRPGACLVNISLLKNLPEEAEFWNDRSVYIIMYTWGKKSTPLSFSVDVDGLADNQPRLDIAVAGRYLDNKRNVKTDEYTTFLNKFPKWTDVEPWLAAYESWVY